MVDYTTMQEMQNKINNVIANHTHDPLNKAFLKVIQESCVATQLMENSNLYLNDKVFEI